MISVASLGGSIITPELIEADLLDHVCAYEARYGCR